MKRIFLLSLLLMIITACSSGEIIADKKYPEKQIPEQVRSPIYEALRAYPELKGVKIKFEFKDNLGMHFMQAQPVPSTVLNSPEERTYVIKMTPKMVISEDQVIPIEKMPREVLVGWFAHELGHIKDYTDEGPLDMIWFGIRYYLSSDFKIAAERQADIFAIEAGFSEEIIATKNFILNNSALPEEYISKIESLYLSPANVLDIVDELAEEDSEEEMSEELEEVSNES